MSPDPTLTADELVQLVRRVFAPGEADRSLCLLVDIPDSRSPDTPAWRARRAMAADWHNKLQAQRHRTGLQVSTVVYANVHHSNADLPPWAYPHRAGPLPDVLRGGQETARPFAAVLRDHPIFIALTQFSATAPLKVGARQHGFRAATLPGFTAEMIPALRLDFVEVNRRVERIKGLLDQAQGARLRFAVDRAERHELHIDLRHRRGHASGGVLHEAGLAGNLPAGEAYIVPYEGEVPGVASRTEGQLPVQLGDEVVVYEVRANQAVGVRPGGAVARAEAARLAQEPAYGNLAELGLGVLADFGLRPIGELLLDEKLGLHIAFGRSDHFGGQTGPGRFTCPEAVVHIDRVYTPAIQPRVSVVSVDLTLPDATELPLIREDRTVVDFGG